MKDNQQNAFGFEVNHISSYALTVEPKTALDSFIKKGKYPPIDEDKALQHFDILVEETEKNGFIQYEISNFGKEGFFSKHNTSYWKGISYLGIGPSAHSYDGLQRGWNVANNAKYMSSIQKDLLPLEKELLSVEDRINESIMTGLRTIWGVSLQEIGKRKGEKYKTEILFQAEKYLEKEILYVEQDHLILRPESYFLADGISADLFLLKV